MKRIINQSLLGLSALLISFSAIADDIHVYFNHSVNPPAIQADLEQKIIEVINGANSTLDMAVYDLDLPGIATAMVNARRRGVNVRFVTDEDNIGAENAQALSILDAGGVPWIDDTADGSSGSGIMHNKFIVADGQIVLTGSTNMSQSGVHGDLDANGNIISGSEGNENHIVIVDSIEMAQVFTSQFNQLWGDGPGGQQDSLFGLNKADHYLQTVHTTHDNIAIDVQFAPQSPSVYIGSTIESMVNAVSTAQSRILLAQFVISAQDVADAMELRHNAGVLVEGIGDRGFFNRYYSEFLDIGGNSATNTSGEYEVDNFTRAVNNPWSNPADVRMAATSAYDKFHHKYIVIDSSVITGSHNVSTAAATANDENIVIIHDAETANEFAGHFSYAYCLAGGSTDCGNTGSGSTGGSSGSGGSTGGGSTGGTSYDPGTWEGVSFSAEEVGVVLDMVNNASLTVLDDDVPLNRRAANNIVNARPIADMDALAAVSYVGTSALQSLKDYVPNW